MQFSFNMNEEEKLQYEEYETRVLVFKCELDSTQYYGVDHSAIYEAKLFKGTRKQFDDHLNEFFKGRNVKPHTIYYEQSKIDKVTHGHCDNNIIYVNNNKKQTQRQAEYKLLKSSY